MSAAFSSPAALPHHRTKRIFSAPQSTRTGTALFQSTIGVDFARYESAWATQGIAPGEFTLVYGVNVLHVAKDLLFSLRQARNTLAPDGWLVISECVRPSLNQPMYPELVFQILDSFTEVETNPEFRPNPVSSLLIIGGMHSSTPASNTPK